MREMELIDVQTRHRSQTTPIGGGQIFKGAIVAGKCMLNYAAIILRMGTKLLRVERAKFFGLYRHLWYSDSGEY